MENINSEDIKNIIKSMISNDEIVFNLDLDIFDGYGKINLEVYIEGECVQCSSINIGRIR